MSDPEEPDFNDTPPLQYTLSIDCLYGRISLQEMAERLGMDLETAKGCVEVVRGWEKGKIDSLIYGLKGDGIPF